MSAEPSSRAYTLARMAGKIYLVTLRSWATQHVVASVIGVRGDHLVFLDAQGKLAAMFSWNWLRVGMYCHESAGRLGGRLNQTSQLAITCERAERWASLRMFSSHCCPEVMV
jgi:hypothetical protein